MKDCEYAHNESVEAEGRITSVPLDPDPSDSEVVGDRVCTYHGLVAEHYGFEVTWRLWRRRRLSEWWYRVTHTAG